MLGWPAAVIGEHVPLHRFCVHAGVTTTHHAYQCRLCACPGRSILENDDGRSSLVLKSPSGQVLTSATCPPVNTTANFLVDVNCQSGQAPTGRPVAVSAAQLDPAISGPTRVAVSLYSVLYRMGARFGPCEVLVDQLAGQCAIY
jgi:hypothetical protein